MNVAVMVSGTTSAVTSLRRVAHRRFLRIKEDLWLLYFFSAGPLSGLSRVGLIASRDDLLLDGVFGGPCLYISLKLP
jgi:hypothetical protein